MINVENYNHFQLVDIENYYEGSFYRQSEVILKSTTATKPLVIGAYG